MKKASILVVWVLFFFTGCESGGDAHRSGAAPAPSAEGIISDGTSTKEPGNAGGGKEAVSSSQLDQALELQSGVYGLPFGATTDEVMKWCGDNNMTVANPTEKDVKEAARNAVDRISGLKEAYDSEVASLIPLEQELAKLAEGYAQADNVFELAKIAAAAEKLDVLKNPTISYKGQKYYLVRVHKGMEVNVDNEQKVCTDDRITRTAYRLSLTPDEKSEKMMANGLRRLDVFLYGEIGRELRTYASLAIFADSPDRSMDVQFELVMRGISEKYGRPDLNGSVMIEVIKDLLGVEFDEFFFMGQTVWARNLLLFASVYSRDSGHKIGFGVLYFDHKAGTHIFDLHQQAIDDFQKNYHEKKKEALAQIQENF